MHSELSPLIADAISEVLDPSRAARLTQRIVDFVDSFIWDYTMNYPAGCEDGKRDFLHSLGINRMETVSLLVEIETDRAQEFTHFNVRNIIARGIESARVHSTPDAYRYSEIEVSDA